MGLKDLKFQAVRHVVLHLAVIANSQMVNLADELSSSCMDLLLAYLMAANRT